MPASNPRIKQLPRRRLPLAEKRRIVELTLRAGASVRAIAREHDVNRNSLYQWQALYRAGKLGEPDRNARTASTFLPVEIAPTVPSGTRSIVEVSFASGASLRIEVSALDAAVIGALVVELKR